MSKKMQERLKSQIYAFLVNLTHLYTQTRASAQVSAEDKPKIEGRNTVFLCFFCVFEKKAVTLHAISAIYAKKQNNE